MEKSTNVNKTDHWNKHNMKPIAVQYTCGWGLAEISICNQQLVALLAQELSWLRNVLPSRGICGFLQSAWHKKWLVHNGISFQFEERKHGLILSRLSTFVCLLPRMTGNAVLVVHNVCSTYPLGGYILIARGSYSSEFAPIGPRDIHQRMSSVATPILFSFLSV